MEDVNAFAKLALSVKVDILLTSVRNESIAGAASGAGHRESISA